MNNKNKTFLVLCFPFCFAAEQKKTVWTAPCSKRGLDPGEGQPLNQERTGSGGKSTSQQPRHRGAVSKPQWFSGAVINHHSRCSSTYSQPSWERRFQVVSLVPISWAVAQMHSYTKLQRCNELVRTGHRGVPATRTVLSPPLSFPPHLPPLPSSFIHPPTPCPS